MTLSRKDFVRLTVVTLGGGALGLGFPACGSPSTETDAGTGGGSAATGGGGGSSTGGGGGSSTGGGGGSSTGGGGGSSTGGGGGASTCANNGITGNHGHSLMVPAADFGGSGDKTYDITGTSAHSHTITLTAAQRTTILAGTSLTVTSTSSGHTHDVTVTCA
jgi:hypothetical protein